MKKIFNILQWVAAAFFVLMMLGTGSLLSNFFLFIAVFLMAPIKPIRTTLEKIKIKGFLCVILAIVLFFVAIIVSPSAKETNNSPATPSTTIEKTTEGTIEVINTQLHTTEKTILTEESTTEEDSLTTESITKTETTKKSDSTTQKVETTTQKTESTTKKAEKTTQQETTTKKVETTAKQETETKTVETTIKTATTNCKYILNTSSKKFHYPECGSAATISSKNYAESNDSRETLIANKYTPCGNCKP